MCHSTDSRPPAAPAEIAGGVKQSGPLELTAGDGAVFGAFQALPATPNGRNVVILPDVRGVHPYYQDLARQFAAAGFGAAVVDYYGRTAGAGERDDAFDWQQYLPQVQPDQVILDVETAAEWLTSVSPGPVFTVGFCFGGGLSWRFAAAGVDLAGAIGFYGRPAQAADVIEQISVPMLLLIAGDDVATPQEEFHRFAARLQEAGKPFEMHVYDGAPHSFFDRSFAEWHQACEDAWRRMLNFTQRHGSWA